MTKRIPNRTLHRYMETIIAQSDRMNTRIVSLEAPAFTALRADPDFCRIIRRLEGLGYIEALWVDTCNPVSAALTRTGSAYLELDFKSRIEQYWTRGLSIAAIVISLAALLLEFQSRHIFPFS